MDEQHSVQLKLNRLVFSSAHFITYQDDVCERLHGHNYHVSVEVDGPLGKNEYVVDFVALRDAVQQMVDRLDHRMLLPTEHPTIQVLLEGDEVHVSHGTRRWVFPADDCVLLPVANTTSELLARQLGTELLAVLRDRLMVEPTRLKLFVDECDGQSASWEVRPASC